jgi:hypothetical protein
LLSWGFPLSNFACNNHHHRCRFCIDWISFLFVPSSLAFISGTGFLEAFFFFSLLSCSGRRKRLKFSVTVSLPCNCLVFFGPRFCNFPTLREAHTELLFLFLCYSCYFACLGGREFLVSRQERSKRWSEPCRVSWICHSTTWLRPTSRADEGEEEAAEGAAGGASVIIILLEAMLVALRRQGLSADRWNELLLVRILTPQPRQASGIPLRFHKHSLAMPDNVCRAFQSVEKRRKKTDRKKERKEKKKKFDRHTRIATLEMQNRIFLRLQSPILSLLRWYVRW